jgi:hypothetical protein
MNVTSLDGIGGPNPTNTTHYPAEPINRISDIGNRDLVDYNYA